MGCESLSRLTEQQSYESIFGSLSYIVDIAPFYRRGGVTVVRAPSNYLHTQTIFLRPEATLPITCVRFKVSPVPWPTESESPGT